MDTAQQLAASLNREKDSAINQDRPRANGGAGPKSESKKTLQFLDQLLHALQSKKGFKEFAFFVANNSVAQQKLQESPDKSSVSERFVQVGKEQGYKFTEKDVKELVGELCSYSPMEELLSKLADWSKGGLQQFLTEIKNEPGMKKELDKSGDRNNFVIFLKNTFNQPERKKKYKMLTEQDIDEAANLIPFEEKKPEPENPAKVPKIVGRIWC
jgi:hypothetical protein